MVVEPPRPVKASHQPRDSKMLHVKKVNLVLFIAMIINCTAQAKKKSNKIGVIGVRVVRSAQRITGVKLPALQATYSTRYHRKTKTIIKDNNHPSQGHQTVK